MAIHSPLFTQNPRCFGLNRKIRKPPPLSGNRPFFCFCSVFLTIDISPDRKANVSGTMVFSSGISELWLRGNFFFRKMEKKERDFRPFFSLSSHHPPIFFFRTFFRSIFPPKPPHYSKALSLATFSSLLSSLFSVPFIHPFTIPRFSPGTFQTPHSCTFPSAPHIVPRIPSLELGEMAGRKRGKKREGRGLYGKKKKKKPAGEGEVYGKGGRGKESFCAFWGKK